MRDGPRGFSRDSSCPGLLRCRPCHLCASRTGLSPSAGARSIAFRCAYMDPWAVLQPRHAPKRRRFGLVPVRSPLLGESFLLSFPAGTKMFQFPAFASAHRADVGIAPDGLPHSDICGSRCICHSPQLFAACHVLLRLREPRHPPCALMVPLCLSLPCGRIVSELSSTSVFSPFDLLVKLLLCFYSCLPRFSLSADSFQICHCAPFCGGE